jgi:uncharacterized membrane protein YgdD (TMEM256/DUF423 family)
MTPEARRRRGLWAAIGAASGFCAVAVGAFGAHGLFDPQAKDWIATGAKYHLAHTMTIFVSLSMENWGAPRAKAAPPFFLVGIIVFAGSLYLMAIGGPRWLGAVTPIGGLSFLVGWVILAAAGLELYRKERPL